MKYYLLLILTTLIVLSGCSKLINENVKENSEDIIGVEKPMEYISNHFLDQAISRLGIIDSRSREMETNVHTVQDKYNLLGICSARNVSNTFDESEVVFQEVYDEMKSAIDSIQVKIETEDGAVLDLSNADSGYLNGIDFYKNDFISLVDCVNTEDKSRGVWKVGDWRWPAGTIRYRFNEGLSDEKKQAIKKAMATWEDSTGKLDFEEIEDTW